MGSFVAKNIPSKFIQIIGGPCQLEDGEYLVYGWQLFGLTEEGEVFRTSSLDTCWLPLPTWQRAYDELTEPIKKEDA